MSSIYNKYLELKENNEELTNYLNKIKTLNFDEITPKESIQILYKLQSLL